MKVVVKAFATIREILGGTGWIVLEVPEDANVGRLLEILSERTGERFRREVLEESGEPRGSIKILVNGRDIEFLDGLSTRLKDGDEVALIPPIAGGMALTKSEMKRYDRQLRISEIGVKGQLKLKSSKVLVAGVGGLGGIASMYLAAAGVGTIRLVDEGELELSNLNRQLPYSEAEVGKLKVEAAARRLRAMNSEIVVEAVNKKITGENIGVLLEDVDLVIDGQDNFMTRFVINDECVKRGIPFIHGAIYALEGRLMTVIPGKGPCLRCLIPKPPPEHGTIPVLGPVPGVIGSLEALEALKILTGLGKPFLGKLLVFDGSDISFKIIPIERSPHCPVCAKKLGRFR